jgi:hypothetical protein
MGWCPSGRLFEAAACGTPLLTDAWEGLEAVLTPWTRDPGRAEHGGRGGGAGSVGRGAQSDGARRPGADARRAQLGEARGRAIGGDRNGRFAPLPLAWRGWGWGSLGLVGR